MSGTDALLTISELAISIAGFSAVVAVFSNRDGLSESDRVRFVWLFTTAFVAALLAFLPILLELGGIPYSVLWRSASGCMIVAWFASILPWLFMRRRWRRLGNRSPIGFGEPYALMIPSTINLVLQVLNSIGIFWTPSPAAYVLGTLIWLYAASLVFVSMLLDRADV